MNLSVSGTAFWATACPDSSQPQRRAPNRRRDPCNAGSSSSALAVLTGSGVYAMRVAALHGLC